MVLEAGVGPGYEGGVGYRRGSRGSGRISLLNRRARGRFFSRYRRGTKSTFTKEVFGVSQIKEHLNVRDFRPFAKMFEV